MGSAAISAWAVQSSDVGFFSNSIGTNGTPNFHLPYAWPSDIAQPGSYSFYQATNLHYKDPYVQEWNLTLERDLGQGIGLRLSYDGNHSSNLGMHTNLNQPVNNTIGLATCPFGLPAPAFPVHGLQHQRWLRKLQRDDGIRQKALCPRACSSKPVIFMPGTYPTWTAPRPPRRINLLANLEAPISDPHHPGLDYGNVAFTRRNRFLTTFLYELPFGKGQNASEQRQRILGPGCKWLGIKRRAAVPERAFHERDYPRRPLRLRL